MSAADDTADDLATGRVLDMEADPVIRDLERGAVARVRETCVSTAELMALRNGNLAFSVVDLSGTLAFSLLKCALGLIGATARPAAAEDARESMIADILGIDLVEDADAAQDEA